MAENDDKQEAARSKSRSRSAEERKAADDAQEPTQGEGGAQTPPAPPAPTEEQGGGETYAKDLLISRANSLLGYSPALARGVLAEADDELTIDQAKERIQQYLDSPVVNEEG